MTIRLIHSNDVTINRADIATRYTDMFFDDEANVILLPDPSGMLELKFVKANSATTTSTTSSPPLVGSAPNPFAPVVVTTPQGYKAGCVDDGVELTLDTIVVRLNTASPRSLQFKLTTGTMSVNISGVIYWTNNGNGNYGSNYWQSKTLTTTWQQPFGWDFPWANDNAVYNVQDLTNKRFYRITLSIGPGYKGNFIVMERLV